MKAVFIEQPGDAGALRYADFAKPEPASGQVLVKVAAAGVNFIDTYQRSGLYKIPLPAVLGMEGAGTVESLGPDTAGFKVGEGAQNQQVLVSELVWEVHCIRRQYHLHAQRGVACLRAEIAHQIEI